MQCPSCQFENMPGSGNCARCGALLTLAAASIDVHPPRAGKLVKAAPSLFILRRAWYKLQTGVVAALAAIIGSTQTISSQRPTLLGMIVPGLAQIQRGDRLRGYMFLCIFAALLVTGLVLTGTTMGSFLLGLAFAAHVTALTDATSAVFVALADRLRFTVAVGLGLLVFLYLPTGWGFSRVATPVRLAQPLPPFSQGDVLWYNRSATPEEGDLVLYEVPRVSINGRLIDGRAARIVIEGQRINRVVALPGQTIQWQEGELLVDGTPSQWQPSTRVSADDVTQTIVPDESFFILPDNLVPGTVENTKMIWRQVSLVKQERVLGRVYFRSLPLTKMTVIR